MHMKIFKEGMLGLVNLKVMETILDRSTFCKPSEHFWFWSNQNL